MGYLNHLFSYVDNNPINYTDKYGLFLDDFLPSHGGNVGTAVGAECVSKACMRGASPRSYMDAYGDCMAIVSSYTRNNPELAAAINQAIGGTDAVIDACASFCSKTTSSDKYKKKCLNNNVCIEVAPNKG